MYLEIHLYQNTLAISALQSQLGPFLIMSACHNMQTLTQLRATFFHRKVSSMVTCTLKLHVNYTVKKDTSEILNENTTSCPGYTHCIFFYTFMFRKSSWRGNIFAPAYL
jgi:hypothetical protein